MSLGDDLKTLYVFYYDESGHSRRITTNTINGDGFSDYFVSAIVGWPDETSSEIEESFRVFENKYKNLFQINELKSAAIREKKYSHGLASFKPDDLVLVRDYLSILRRHNAVVYALIDHKIEFLVGQRLVALKNQHMFDLDALRYSITKYLSLHKPKRVMEALFEGNDDFIKEFKSALKEQRIINGDAPIRDKENAFIDNTLEFLEEVEDLKTVDWRYAPSFFGFSDYLDQIGVGFLKLTIDKEGSGKTLEAARQMGFPMSEEADSKDVPGLRIADWFAGILSRFIKSIGAALSVKNRNAEGKTLLPERWFDIDREEFELYQLMYDVIVDQNNAWNKITCSTYSDGPTAFIVLLSYFKGMTFDEFKTISAKEHSEYYNSALVSETNRYFKRLNFKLAIEPLSEGVESWRNHQGAVVHKDHSKHSLLEIGARPRVLFVRSVGLYHDGTPTVTVEENGIANIYLLPCEFHSWALTLIGLASIGDNLFPSRVEFGKKSTGYYARIL